MRRENFGLGKATLRLDEFFESLYEFHFNQEVLSSGAATRIVNEQRIEE